MGNGQKSVFVIHVIILVVSILVHLWEGTHKENMDDRDRKGRCAPPRIIGEQHGRAKLTEQQVREMRASSKMQIDLADEYGITQGAVTAIVNRRTWKHVE